MILYYLQLQQICKLIALFWGREEKYFRSKNIEGYKNYHIDSPQSHITKSLFTILCFFQYFSRLKALKSPIVPRNPPNFKILQSPIYLQYQSITPIYLFREILCWAMQFQVQKKDLIEIVKTYQEASYTDHFNLLLRRGDNLDWLLTALATDPKNGISSAPESIRCRKEVFGSNEKEPKQPPSLLSLFCEALDDFILKILMLSACVSIGLEVGLADPADRKTAWVEGFAILVAVFVCASVAAGNNYQKEKQFLELNSVADEKKRVTVWRGGATLQIHQDFVLVGDIVSVTEGMEIPADGILIESNDITIDESSMTGETNPIVKNILSVCVRKQSSNASEGEKHVATSPVIMGGTRALTGEGKMVIVVVGDQSCIGKIRAMLEQDDETETPLQQKLVKLADDIGKFALASSITIMAVLFIRYGIFKIQNPTWDTKLDLERLLGYLIIGITVIVVAIPEGLPLSVTLSLAFSVKKMLKDHNLVRRMEACETMGGANNICSDKTGTLTMNKMILTEIWNGKNIKVDTYAETLSPKSLSTNPEFIELFKIGCLVNSTALLLPEEKGSSTEIALLKYFAKMGVNYQDERIKYPTNTRFPFSSARKRMSVIVEINGEKYLFTKGASEIVLKGCNYWMNSEKNETENLTEDIKRKIQDVITTMAKKSLRTLCIGFRKLGHSEDYSEKDKRGIYKVETEKITLVAVIGVRDNPRQEVPDAIKKCHIAGITVRMVTGDNIITAKAIATEIGLIKENDDSIAMEGTEFNKLVGGIVCKACRTPVCPCPVTTKEAEEKKKDIRVDTVANAAEFDKIADRLFVLARSRPEDKYCLVTGLKERGNVVAVTGDGTNDAPALKKADVGFAMGIAGTEVAREAAAIILIDDNFNSIVKAVLWGRNIYDSIRKFLQFQLTINVVAVLITLVGSALIEKQVLRPIQMLWINLIMDSLASLALSTENPHENLLLRKPYTRDANIVSKLMTKNIIGQSIFQLIIMIGMIFFGEQFIPEYEDSLDQLDVYKIHPQYKWYQGVVGGTVCSGRFYWINGNSDYETAFLATKNYSRHYTFIFNTFVMLQIFNFINSRKIHGEFNVFKGMIDHGIFCVIVFVILGIQIIIVSFTGYGFGLYPNGLTVEQWGISLGIGSTSLIMGVLLKFIPYGNEERDDAQIANKGTGNDDIYQKLIEDS